MGSAKAPSNDMNNMNFEDTNHDQTKSKIRLLREVMEVVMWELRAVQDGRWEDLPGLHTKKQQFITRMSEFDWHPALSPDDENPELLLIQAQIVDIEYQIRKKLEVQMSVIKSQIGDLDRRNIRWKKSIKAYYKQ